MNKLDTLPLPSQEELRLLFSYDQKTGVLLNLVTRASKAPKGARAGNVKGNGYRRVRIEGREYLEHRLVWKLVYGVDPVDTLDHINGVRSDNRLANLRDCTTADNNRFAAAKRHSLPLGVKQLKEKGKAYDRYMARATVDGKRVYLGTFSTPEQASQAYQEALKVIKDGGQVVSSAKPTSSGYKGVSWEKAKRKWRACVRIDGNRKHLGYHDTPEQAHQAYLEAIYDLERRTRQ